MRGFGKSSTYDYLYIKYGCYWFNLNGWLRFGLAHFWNGVAVSTTTGLWFNESLP